jgi:hypothetical protein
MSYIVNYWIINSPYNNDPFLTSDPQKGKEAISLLISPDAPPGERVVEIVKGYGEDSAKSDKLPKPLAVHLPDFSKGNPFKPKQGYAEKASEDIFPPKETNIDWNKVVTATLVEETPATNKALRDEMAKAILEAFWISGNTFRSYTDDERLLPREERLKINRSLSYEEIAFAAYEQADAMLKVRRRGGL